MAETKDTMDAAEAALALWCKEVSTETLQALTEFLGTPTYQLSQLPAQFDSTVKAMALIGLLRAVNAAGIPSLCHSFVASVDTVEADTRITGGN